MGQNYRPAGKYTVTVNGKGADRSLPDKFVLQTRNSHLDGKPVSKLTVIPFFDRIIERLMWILVYLSTKIWRIFQKPYKIDNWEFERLLEPNPLSFVNKKAYLKLTNDAFQLILTSKWDSKEGELFERLISGSYSKFIPVIPSTIFFEFFSSRKSTYLNSPEMTLFGYLSRILTRSCRDLGNILKKVLPRYYQELRDVMARSYEDYQDYKKNLAKRATIPKKLSNKTPADQRDIFRPKSLRKRLLDNKFVPCWLFPTFQSTKSVENLTKIA